MIKNTVHASAWTSLTPAPAQYRWLDEDTACEVAVVGGGIAAAMHVDGTDVPWEDKRCNPFMALYQTILRVMFNAPRFFAALPASNGKLTRPLVFYLILGLFQTLVERMWYLMSIQASGPSITDPKLQEVLGDMAQSMSLPLTILLTPGILAIQLCFFASVFYLMLRLVQPGHRLQRRAHRGLHRPAGRPARGQHLVRRLLLHRLQVLHAPAVVAHRAGPRPALPHRVRHRHAAYPAVPEHERLKNRLGAGRAFPKKGGSPVLSPPPCRHKAAAPPNGCSALSLPKPVGLTPSPSSPLPALSQSCHTLPRCPETRPSGSSAHCRGKNLLASNNRSFWTEYPALPQGKCQRVSSPHNNRRSRLFFLLQAVPGLEQRQAALRRLAGGRFLPFLKGDSLFFRFSA